MNWLLSIAKPFVLKQAAVLGRNLALVLVGLLLSGLAKFSITLPRTKWRLSRRSSRPSWWASFPGP